MHTAPINDHYQPIKGGRNAPLVATYAHTTPLVPPVPIAAAPKQAVHTDVVTNIQPSQPVVATTTATTVAAAPLVTQSRTVQQTTTTASEPVISAPAAVATTTTSYVPLAASQTATTTTATQQPLAAASRPTQVTQTIYPTAADDAAAVGTAAAVVGAAAVATRTTQTTTTQRAAVPVVAAGARRGLDLDMTATSVDSYSAPTPIHLTIHADPTETAAVGAAGMGAADANAIAYLHSVHPALPASSASSSDALQQPQPSHARRGSEGAATSLNGQWTPMSTGTQEALLSPGVGIHGDQVYASEAPPIPARPMQGAVVTTNTHDHQYYANRANVDRDAAGVTAAGAALGAGAAYSTVSDVSQLTGEGRTAVPVAGMAATRPMVVGETQEMGGVQRITQVDQASGLTGERIAVASTQRQMPATQTFSSTTGQSIVQVDQASGLRGEPVPISGVAYGSPLVIGETRQLGGVDPRIAQVDQASGLTGERIALASVQRQMPASQTFSSTTGPAIVQVDQASGLRGEPVAVVSTHRPMPAGQTFTSTSAQAVTQVDDVTNLQGGYHTPVTVQPATAGSLVIGETHEVGFSDSLEEVDDLGRVRQAVPVPIMSVQRAMPAGQVFTSTGAAQVVQVPGTYPSAIVQPTGTRVTQQLDSGVSGPSIVQVNNAAALTGERLALEQRVSTGALVTSALPVTSQMESVTHVSHASQLQGTPVMVESLARGPLVVGETPQQIGSSGSNIMQVSELRGEPLPITGTATTTGAMRSYELTAAESQPQIRYTFDQTNQAAYNVQQQQTVVQPQVQQQQYVQNAQYVQNVQQQYAVDTVQRTVVQQPILEQRTVVTREAIPAHEAAAQTTSQVVTAGDAQYESLTARQTAGLEEQHQRIDGKVHVMYVDKERMEGREPVPVGPYNAFTKDSVADEEALSSGVKGVQLDDSERQTYTKEQI